MRRQLHGVAIILVGLSMSLLAGCSSDPGRPEVVVHLVWDAPLTAAGEATVQLLPQRPSAGLPVFTGTAPVAASATDVTVTVHYDPSAADALEYRLSARVDVPGALLLGRWQKVLLLDDDGASLRIVLDPP